MASRILAKKASRLGRPRGGSYVHFCWLTVMEVAMEKIMWLVLGSVAFVAALRAARS